MEARKSRIKYLIQQLPITNFTLLKILVEHLRNVASHSAKNLMTISNLGICFAPTLMRGPDNAPSIMEIKYSNVVTNTLIEEFDSIFNDPRLRQQQQHSNYIANEMQLAQNKQLQQNQIHPSQPSTNSHQKNHPQSLQQQPPHFRQGYNANQSNNNNLNNHDDHFGLGLPANFPPQQYLQNQQNHQPSAFNSLQYYPQMEPTSFSSFQYYPVHPGVNPYQYYSMESNKLPYRSNRVITLYACVADTESELSFGPNEIISDGKYRAIESSFLKKSTF